MSEHDVGFHEGERAVQTQAGVRARAQDLAAMLETPDLRGGAARFLAERTFVAVAARDRDGRLWISPLAGPRGFLAVVDATSLAVHAAPLMGDPLHDLAPEQPVGMIAIEFATRRRVRVNGTLTSVDGDRLLVHVDQAYGNCPQYIQERGLEPRRSVDDPGAGLPRRSTVLRAEDVRLIRHADTFFLGTTHPDRGNDASHRGGPIGFIRVEGSSIWWPDYPGNNMFNSFGNLAVDSTAALLFADFSDGRTLHLSGTADVRWDRPGSPGDDGHTGRSAWFTPEQVVAGRFLPVRSGGTVAYGRNPPITGRDRPLGD